MDENPRLDSKFVAWNLNEKRKYKEEKISENIKMVIKFDHKSVHKNTSHTKMSWSKTSFDNEPISPI